MGCCQKVAIKEPPCSDPIKPERETNMITNYYDVIKYSHGQQVQINCYKEYFRQLRENQ